MSVFSAMATAVTGLTAQSRKMGHISDNIANVSTISYKKIGTSFSTLVTQSGLRTHSPGGVVATPKYNNTLQGLIQASASPMHLAISGNGYFIVRNFPDDADTAGLNRQSSYTRKGDFQLDDSGNMVNSSGMFLQGRAYDLATGTLAAGDLSTVNVGNLTGLAKATQNVTIGLNLPANARIASTTVPVVEVVDYNGIGTAAGGVSYGVTVNGQNVATAVLAAGADIAAALVTAINANATLTAQGVVASSGGVGLLTIDGPTDGSPVSFLAGNTTANEISRTLGQEVIALGGSDYFADQNVYDSQGQAHSVRTEFVKTGNNQWAIRLIERDPSGTWLQLNPTPIVATFNVDGKLASITGGVGGTVGFLPLTGAAPFTNTDPPWQWNDASMQINFGTPGEPKGLTQASDDFALTTLQQDGLPYGQFAGVEVDELGDVYANFRNGAAVKIYQLPIAHFSNADGLQNVDGNVFSATQASGDPSILSAGVGPAGTIVAEALESSNVDIAEEFTQMIQTQRAYSANSRVITTADQMTEEIINIKR